MSQQRILWFKTKEGKQSREQLREERKGPGNPRWGYKEPEEHKRKRMKNMLAKPRWNTGLTKETDVRIAKLGHRKGKKPYNAYFYKATNLLTQEEHKGYIKDISIFSGVPIVTIKKMLKSEYNSHK